MRMTTVDNDILISAPPQKIFAFLIKPGNLPRICPGILEIKNEQLLPNGGYSATWVFKTDELCLKGTGEYIDVAENRYFTIKTKGAVDSTITLTVRSIDVLTRVTLTIEYPVSVPVLAWLSGNNDLKMNEHMAELILTKLKVIMEIG
jgi:carbon monoxide dehydrogenase subunit G